MRIFIIRPAALIFWLVLPVARNRLKNLFTAVNASKRATRILLRKVKKIFLLQKKMSNLTLVLTKLMQLRRVTVVQSHKYLVTVNRGLKAEPPVAGRFFNFAAKNSNLSLFQSHFALFEAT